MNSVNIIGRLGSDIELRTTPSGKSVAEANIAVDDGFGENKKTVWLGVTIWGVTADLAAKALSKGSLVGISGRLSQDEWEDKQTGKKQRKTKITCESMKLIESKRENLGIVSPEFGKRETAPAPTQTIDETDDIPF